MYTENGLVMFRKQMALIAFICLFVLCGEMSRCSAKGHGAGTCGVNCLAPLLDGDRLVDDMDKNMVLTPISDRLRPVGSGGMGNVYVRDYKFSRKDGTSFIAPVAEKVFVILWLDKDPTFWMKRFNEEVRIMDLLSKDPYTAGYIPRIYYSNSDSSSNRFLIAMEYLDGFKKLSDFDGTFDQRLELFFECAKALDRIHAKGIVHHDICPSNIMYRIGADGGVEVRVIDFGLSGDMHKKTSIVGHLHYLPKEALPRIKEGVWVPRKHLYMAKTDIFSLGTVFAELLVGDFKKTTQLLYEQLEADRFLGAQGQELVETVQSNSSDDSQKDPALSIHAKDAFAVGKLERELDLQRSGTLISLFSDAMEKSFPGYTADPEMYSLYCLVCGMMNPDSDHRYGNLDEVVFELLKIRADMLGRKMQTTLAESA